MKFRDAEQRARVCRALLTTTMHKERVELLWSRRGPTNLAIALAQDSFEVFRHEQRNSEHKLPQLVSFRLAWDVWNDGGNFKITDALAHWDARGWEIFASFCEALADDAAHVEDDYPAAVPIPDMPGAVPVGHYEMAMPEETALDAWVRSVETEYEWRKVDGDG